MTSDRPAEPPDELLRELLLRSRTLAVVGLSERPDRPSHEVARRLKEAGYRIIPVNPNAGSVLGEPSYPSLREVPGPVDMAVVFRRPEHVGAVVDEAIQAKVPVVWMQLGIREPEAARRAEAAGIEVIMDRCTWIEYQRLFGPRR